MGNLKTVVKKHPLKDIILDFDLDITPPPFEVEALNYYYEAHDKTWTIKQHAMDMEKRLEEANAIIEDLVLRRLGIEQELEILEDWLGVAELEDIPYFEESITIDINVFLTSCLKHNEDLNQLYEKVDAITSTYNRDVENIYEDDYLIDPMYFDTLDDLYPRYDELSVHTVSLDDDHQEFLGTYSKVSELFFHYMDMGGELFDRYGTLVEVCQSLYYRVEDVDQIIRDKIKGLDNEEK